MGSFDAKDYYILDATEPMGSAEILRRVEHIGLAALSMLGLKEWTAPRLARNEAHNRLAWSLFHMDDATKVFRLSQKSAHNYTQTAWVVGEFQEGSSPFPLSSDALRSMSEQARLAGAERMKWDIDHKLPGLRNAARLALENSVQRQRADRAAWKVREALSGGITPAAVRLIEQERVPDVLELHVPEQVYRDVFRMALPLSKDPEQYGFPSTSEALGSCLQALGLPPEAQTIVSDYMLAGIEAFNAISASN